MTPLNEMQKLSNLLNKACIPYEVAFDYFSNMKIMYPNQAYCKCDVICNDYSYGGTEGLLEIMGLVDNDNEDTVEGYLTAEEVAKRIIEHWIERF